MAPKGSQQIIAAGGQEYRDLGLGRRPARLALEDRDHGSSWSGRGGGGGGGSGGGYVGASGAGPDYRDAAGSAQSREGGDDRDNSSRYNRKWAFKLNSELRATNISVTSVTLSTICNYFIEHRRVVLILSILI